jgi:hypothetical protein
MQNKDKHFYDWAYILHAAELFHGIERIHLTGGEPSMHPHFNEWVPILKNIFHCKKLTIETNGFGLEKYGPTYFTGFDEIYFSHYKENFYPGFKDNLHIINTFENYVADWWPCYDNIKVHVGEITHMDRSARPGTKMCDRGTSETVAYVDGKIYPCCIGSGLDTKIYLDNPGADWREKILEIHPPCHDCFFALP